jgi:hypothetical protein
MPLLLVCSMALPGRVSSGLCQQIIPPQRASRGAGTCSSGCQKELNRMKLANDRRTLAEKLAGKTCPTCARYVPEIMSNGVSWSPRGKPVTTGRVTPSDSSEGILAQKGFCGAGGDFGDESE